MHTQRFARTLLAPLLAGLLLVTGCSTAASDATAVPAGATAGSAGVTTIPNAGKPVLPQPTGETGVVGGQIYSTTSNTPLGSVLLRLGDVVRQNGEAAYIIDGARAPGTLTDASGYFAFTDVKPGEYVIAITEAEGVYQIITDQQGNGAIWTVTVGQTTDFGEVKVDYPRAAP